MPAVLKVVDGYLKDRVLVLPSERHFLLGSSLEAALTLYGDQVEDRHAVLVPEGGGHRLVPLASSRATEIDDVRIDEARQLQDGDRIRIGLHEFVYATSADRAQILGAARQAPCSTCGAPLASVSGESTLEGLAIGDDRICPRCVDHRLNVDRDLESFTILRKIGANDEEVTYLAIDQETNARVAIRILKADRQADLTVLRRFLVRGITGLVLEHPNYLETLAIRSSKGITYVVLEHQDRSWKFERFVREQSPIAVDDALTVANQMAEVLRFARTRQLLVAKRKKSGVLVDKLQLWIKVLSFDVTRELERSLAGTDAFKDLFERSGHSLAELERIGFPEPKDEKTARLSRLADEYAEVYSIGRVLYQLISKGPFSAEVPINIRAALMHRKARRPARKDEDLDALPLPVLELLDRVLVPKGGGRIRDLAGFTEGSKTAYLHLQTDSSIEGRVEL